MKDAPTMPPIQDRDNLGSQRRQIFKTIAFGAKDNDENAEALQSLLILEVSIDRDKRVEAA